jgi:hypothetical protein
MGLPGYVVVEGPLLFRVDAHTAPEGSIGAADILEGDDAIIHELLLLFQLFPLRGDGLPARRPDYLARVGKEPFGLQDCKATGKLGDLCFSGI